jgi:hypothetical protein
MEYVQQIKNWQNTPVKINTENEIEFEEDETPTREKWRLFKGKLNDSSFLPSTYVLGEINKESKRREKKKWKSENK